MTLAELLKGSRWLLVLAGLAIATAGCPSEQRRATAPAKAPKLPAAPAAKTNVAKLPPAATKKAPPRAAPQPKVATAPKVAPKPTPPVAPKPDTGTKPLGPTTDFKDVKPLKKPFDRKTLESAYVEISCIQKKGQATKLLAAYKKYGFGDPKAWIAAWESQKKTKDYEQWLAGITQKAWKACP